MSEVIWETAKISWELLIVVIAWAAIFLTIWGTRDATKKRKERKDEQTRKR
jgi:membrane protein implicated in regulation of membrane protease activity